MADDQTERTDNPDIGNGQPEARQEPERRRLAGVVQAGRAELRQGAAIAIVANEANVTMGGAVVAVAEHLTVQQGGSEWLIAREARLDRSGTVVLVAGDVDAPEARIGVAVGNHIEGNLQVGVLLAGRVDGNVQAVMDTPTAIRFGAAAGLALGLMLLLRRLITGR